MKKLLLSLCLLAMSLVALADNRNWMGRLDDNLFVHQLTIPGAHDAATGSGTVADEWARTQDHDLPAQLRAGVRAFDLRPAVSGDSLHIFHGRVRTNKSFAGALNDFIRFLAENPSEFIIVEIQHERDGDNNNPNWNRLVSQVLNSASFRPHLAAFRPDLRVGELRGKILMLSRDRYAELPVGAFVDGWSFEADLASQAGASITNGRERCQLVQQDYYDMTAPGAPAIKSNAIQTLAEYSTQLDNKDHSWFGNNVSGFALTTDGHVTRTGYRDNAATQNNVLLRYLRTARRGPLGIILMDFAGSNKSGGYRVNSQRLINALIKQNFR